MARLLAMVAVSVAVSVAVWVAVALLPAACESQLSIDCDHRPAESMGVLPKVAQPSAAEARAISHRYLTAAVCTGRLPTDMGLQALGFSSGDLGTAYRPGRLQDGFGKQASAQAVQFPHGRELLFCFNQWVIACAPGDRCRCPYDDNPPGRHP
jgi:hypothetical protein